MIRQAAILTIALLGSASALAAQSNADDPWQKVPPLPTTCYADQEFSAKLGEIHAELASAVREQTLINEELSRKLQEVGPQEITRRLMEFMQKDPQKAMKMMEAQSAAASNVASGVTSADEAKKERDAEFVQLSEAFRAELDAAARPLEARRGQIIEASRQVINDKWQWDTKAAETEFNDLINKQNADYEARCATYLGPNGKVRSWLASYRSTVLDPTAASTETNDGIKEMQLSILDSPSAGFRSTGQMEAARDYVQAVRKAFDLRRPKLEEIH